MNEILLEQKIILVSTRTICSLFDQENWSDLVALYMFYHKQCKLQKTNQTFTTSDFTMKWLSWWNKRFKDAKNTLINMKLIEDITTRDNKWVITWWFIKLNYIESHTPIGLSTPAETHSVDESTGGWQKTNAWSIKDINAWSIKGETETSHIEEKNPTEKSKSKLSSSIRKGSKPIRTTYVPPTKEQIIELLWDKSWVYKFYEILTIPKMKDELSLEQVSEVYKWTIEFFQEKYDWKIYRDSDTWKMIWYQIIINELDKFIAYYSEKGDDILSLKARLRKWITNSLKYSA